MSYASLILNQIKPVVPSIPNNDVHYSSPSMAAFRPSMMYKGPASFDSYEFVFAFGNIPDINIENKCHTVGKDKFICVNPMQSHGTVFDQAVNCYMPIFIDKNKLIENAYAIAGKKDVEFSNSPISYDQKLLNIIHNFISESQSRQLGYHFVIESITTQFVAHLIRNIKNNAYGGVESPDYRDNKSVQRVVEFLWENYDKDFRFEDIARIINYSPYHFIRIFKNVTGKTPHEYFVDIKLQKALEKLKYTSCTITEICYSCGFNNLNHFSGVFRKRIGMSPTEYRKKLSV